MKGNLKCKPLCRMRPRLLLLLTFVSFSDSTDVLLESAPSSSVFSSTAGSAAAGELGSVRSSLGLSGVASGAADSASGLAGVFSASAVGDNKSKPHSFVVVFKVKKNKWKEKKNCGVLQPSGTAEAKTMSAWDIEKNKKYNCYTIAKLVRMFFFSLNLVLNNLYFRAHIITVFQLWWPPVVLPFSLGCEEIPLIEGIWWAHRGGNEVGDYWPVSNEPQPCSCWELWESRVAPSLSDPGLGGGKAHIKGRGRWPLLSTGRLLRVGRFLRPLQSTVSACFMVKSCLCRRRPLALITTPWFLNTLGSYLMFAVCKNLLSKTWTEKKRFYCGLLRGRSSLWGNLIAEGLSKLQSGCPERFF